MEAADNNLYRNHDEDGCRTAKPPMKRRVSSAQFSAELLDDVASNTAPEFLRTVSTGRTPLQTRRFRRQQMQAEAAHPGPARLRTAAELHMVQELARAAAASITRCRDRGERLCPPRLIGRTQSDSSVMSGVRTPSPTSIATLGATPAPQHFPARIAAGGARGSLKPTRTASLPATAPAAVAGVRIAVEPPAITPAQPAPAAADGILASTAPPPSALLRKQRSMDSTSSSTGSSSDDARRPSEDESPRVPGAAEPGPDAEQPSPRRRRRKRMMLRSRRPTVVVPLSATPGALYQVMHISSTPCIPTFVVQNPPSSASALTKRSNTFSFGAGALSRHSAPPEGMDHAAIHAALQAAHARASAPGLLSLSRASPDSAAAPALDASPRPSADGLRPTSSPEGADPDSVAHEADDRRPPKRRLAERLRNFLSHRRERADVAHPPPALVPVH